MGRGLGKMAAETVGRTGRHLIARAASFLLLADSRASFEIEGERPPRNRLERWGRAVLQAGRNPLSLDELNRELCRRIRSGDIGLATPGIGDHMRATTLDKVGIDQPTYSGFRAARKKP